MRALGYSDFFSYQASEYGVSADEMLELNEQLVRELRPLYRELHTWGALHAGTTLQPAGARHDPGPLAAQTAGPRTGPRW